MVVSPACVRLPNCASEELIFVCDCTLVDRYSRFVPAYVLYCHA